MRARTWDILSILFIVVIAAFFRFLYLEDMEYKFDEKWMFERSQVPITSVLQLPAVGMPSSVGIPNFGASAWIFIGLAKFMAVSDPVQLAQAVVILNVLAFFVGMLLFLSYFEGPEKEAWRWGFALAAVNTLSILYHRKIWAQSVFPLFSVLFLWCFLKKRNLWGAVGFGFLSVFLGQIQMSGFFFAGAFLIWGFLFDRKQTHWKGVLGGILFAVFPMIPWFAKLPQILATAQPHESLNDLLRFKYFRNWVTDAWGVNLRTFFGDESKIWQAPLLGESATQGIKIFQIVSTIVGTLILGLAMIHWIRQTERFQKFFGSCETQWLLWPAILGTGLLMFAARVIFHRHYLLVTFPLEYVWLAYLAFKYVPKPRQLLSVLWILQFLTSLTTLYYIHSNCGDANSGYGVAYRCLK